MQAADVRQLVERVSTLDATVADRQQLCRAAADVWLQQAIAQGHVIATVWLADLRTDSDDPSGYPEAAELYRRAAETSGDGWSALRMGMMYAMGEGVPADDAQALEWFTRLGTEFELDPTEFSNPDLEVMGGFQLYYGIDFTGGELERDLEAAEEAFRIAVEFPALLTHPSFQRAAETMLARLGN